ncbi:uncharacterized protein LOC111344711 [Stylophora pistillata]|uniref:uncharacterized protein LOC111344711 n=1 Tax=Stylophora pistillata TaxID=50429 RepID=UPI000C04064A|nr:uncharacterized protein LOC111344711 [Stylophora pistillata]
MGGPLKLFFFPYNYINGVTLVLKGHILKIHQAGTRRKLSRGFRLFALLLLFIGTPKGRQIYGRAKTVEADRGIKTNTWDDVIDYNAEIHQERDNKEHDECSSNIAKAKRGCAGPDLCAVLNEVISCLSNDEDKRNICQYNTSCICKFKGSILKMECFGCVKSNRGSPGF